MLFPFTGWPNIPLGYLSGRSIPQLWRRSRNVHPRAARALQHRRLSSRQPYGPVLPKAHQVLGHKLRSYWHAAIQRPSLCCTLEYCQWKDLCHSMVLANLPRIHVNCCSALPYINTIILSITHCTDHGTTPLHQQKCGCKDCKAFRFWRLVHPIFAGQ